MPEQSDNRLILNEAALVYRADAGAPESCVLDDSLAMTPWERMLANDDIVNFGNMLRAAMEKRNAESR